MLTLYQFCSQKPLLKVHESSQELFLKSYKVRMHVRCITQYLNTESSFNYSLHTSQFLKHTSTWLNSPWSIHPCIPCTKILFGQVLFKNRLSTCSSSNLHCLLPRKLLIQARTLLIWVTLFSSHFDVDMLSSCCSFNPFACSFILIHKLLCCSLVCAYLSPLLARSSNLILQLLHSLAINVAPPIIFMLVRMGSTYQSS